MEEESQTLSRTPRYSQIPDWLVKNVQDLKIAANEATSVVFGDPPLNIYAEKMNVYIRSYGGAKPFSNFDE